MFVSLSRITFVPFLLVSGLMSQPSWSEPDLPTDISTIHLSYYWADAEYGYAFATGGDELSTKKKNRFRNAAGKWKTSSSSLRIIEDSSSDNTVHYKRIDGSGGTLGVTNTYYFLSTRTISTSRITFDKKENWDVSKNTSGVNPTKYDFYHVAAHEMGHALGLGHSKAFTNCNIKQPYVMCPHSSTGAQKRSPANGEQQAIRYLYPAQ